MGWRSRRPWLFKLGTRKRDAVVREWAIFEGKGEPRLLLLLQRVIGIFLLGATC